jgi:L-fuconolactonase
MRIDAHQHFWQYDPVRDAWITDEMRRIRQDFLPRDLRPELERNGMVGCIAVQADQSEDETRFLLDLAQQHPFILGVVGWVDLRVSNLATCLEEFASYDRLCGVRHIAQAEPDDFLTTDEVVEGVGLLGEFDLTFDLLVYPNQLDAAIWLVDRHPHQRFVLDHIAKPPIRSGELEPWATLVRELASRPNICCKASGLVTEADWDVWQPADFKPYLDVVFSAFGPRRVMFGSDWPVCLVAASYHQVLRVMEEYASDFSETELEGLFGGNAALFYDLELAPTAG